MILNVACFVAGVVCAICALKYLSHSKAREEAPLRHFALFALAVLGGVLLLFVLAGVWYSHAMKDF